MLSRYAVYAANLLSMMLLARAFTPEEFGTVTSITVFLLFFQLLTEAGLGPAIINTKKLPHNDRDGIFSLTLIIGATLGLAFFLSSGVLADLYSTARIKEIIPLAAISLVFYSACVLPNSFLLREQKYYKISIAGLAAEILSTATAFLLCFFVDPIIALTGKTVASAATNFIFIYVFSETCEFGRPKPGKNLSAIRPLLSFSAYQFAFNLINYFSRNLDNILVGKYLGLTALGGYDKAYQIMRYPLTLLSFSMTPAIQPVIRQYAEDKNMVEKLHSEFTLKLSLIACIAGIAVLTTANLIVTILLGNKWLSVTPLIEILSLSIPVQVILSTSGSFFQALKRVDLLFKSGIISAIITVSSIVAGIYSRDLKTLSILLVISFHLNYLQTYFILYKLVLGANPMKFYAKQAPQLLLFFFIAFLTYTMK